MSSIHLKRAKVWQTSEFNAEWIQNGVEYCTNNPEGRRDLQMTLLSDLGPQGAQFAMRAIAGPLRRHVSGKPPKEGVWWQQVAFDLGINDHALRFYTDLVNAKDLAAPPRLLPAIKRKRGEDSISWLSRRHEAHIHGHKVPEMDWVTARAMAISQFDSVRDTWEAWHTSPHTFFDEIVLRGKTIILSPQILEKPDKDFVRLHKLDDAFRGRVYSLTVGLSRNPSSLVTNRYQLAHMVWLHASELLEDLFNMGLTTSAQIEREYKKDRRLMLRLIACFTKMEGLALHLWSNMHQVVSASPNIAPCLIRVRVSQLSPQILPPLAGPRNACLASFGRARTADWTFEVISELAVGNTYFPSSHRMPWLRFRVVYEFLMQMELSTFGKGLLACVSTLEATDVDLWDVMCPFKLPKTFRPTGHLSIWGPAYTAMVAVRDTWRDIAWRLNMQGTQGPDGLLARIERKDYLAPVDFDEMWESMDLELWDGAAERGLEGRHREVARHFGLYDTADVTRPTSTGRLLREHFAIRRLVQEHLHRTHEVKAQEQARREAAATTPVEIASSPTVAQSGHAYLTATGVVRKEKAKTRKNATVEIVPVAIVPAAIETVDENEVENMPEVLPSHYKLGKKVFHRLLDDDDEPSDDSAPSVTKGQIRWDAFEKAMKRIGFGVCQTAGSSVRFDPPARTARPITFHRPHPDPLLTPNMIKWIGARLKRNYGWTVSSFSQGGEVE
ncbi:hypothetical protein B0H16DRAFT_1696639 [Mycena metata]|uniref:Uncharacterized protein n=1 Tax=Mycena metata TaxID=1033252 RepID=A0AAD7I186_9AGAR|nr:hypothetical protein B0H16DRAFT_1696639 [Mycena metata]